MNELEGERTLLSALTMIYGLFWEEFTVTCRKGPILLA